MPASPAAPKASEPTKPQAQRQPSPQEAEAFAAWQTWSQSGSGSARAFCAARQLSRSTWRHWSGAWRQRAAHGLDPLTGQPSDGAKAFLATLEAYAFKAAAEPEDEDESQAGDDTTREDGFGPLDAATLSEARRIVRMALKGRVKVEQGRLKLARELVLKAGDWKQTAQAAGAAHEFASWPGERLAALVAELAPGALAARPEPVAAGSLAAGLTAEAAARVADRMAGEPPAPVPAELDAALGDGKGAPRDTPDSMPQELGEAGPGHGGIEAKAH